jgi:hypothetical protein
MINTDMKFYDYFTYKDADYGPPILSPEPVGQVKMAIYTTGQSVQQNINYSGASYVGFTHDVNITDKCVIQYENKKLKVLYVGKKGSIVGCTPVYMGAM